MNIHMIPEEIIGGKRSTKKRIKWDVNTKNRVDIMLSADEIGFLDALADKFKVSRSGAISIIIRAFRQEIKANKQGNKKPGMAGNGSIENIIELLIQSVKG